jgi:hypothetical protein
VEGVLSFTIHHNMSKEWSKSLLLTSTTITRQSLTDGMVDVFYFFGWYFHHFLELLPIFDILKILLLEFKIDKSVRSCSLMILCRYDVVDWILMWNKIDALHFTRGWGRWEYDVFISVESEDSSDKDYN